MYDLSKSFYQGNSYKVEGSKDKENDKENNVEDEKAQKVREDPYEANKSGDSTGWPDDEEMQNSNATQNNPTTSADLLGIKDQEMEEQITSEANQTENPNLLAILEIIQSGAVVDCIKYEPGYEDEIDGIWAKANLQLLQDENSFKVSFLRDSEDYDRIIDIDLFDMHIFQEGVKSSEEEDWRSKLKIINDSSGVYLDYYCRGYGWCEARVMASMTSMDERVDQVLIQIVKVPLGMSKSHGSFKDKEFEQISIRSPRIRKRGTRYDSRTAEEIELNEMNKPDNIPVGPCSQRQPRQVQHTVLKLVVVEFFNLGLDQSFLNRLTDSENPVHLKLFMKILEYFTRFKRMTPEENKAKFQSDFEGAIETYVQSEYLKNSIKEFKYEYFGTIYSSNKTVVLDVALQCLESDSLSTRVNGVKYIDNISSKCIRGTSNEYKKDEVGEWISKNKVIEHIYGTNHHSELFSRSEHILKVLAKSKVGFTQEEMELIWNLTKRDNQTKGEIYSIIQNVNETLGKTFIEFIMDKILSYEHINATDLSFLLSFKNKTAIQTECIWKILNNVENYTEDVVQTAYQKIIDNAKFVTLEKKVGTINECIKNIKLHKSSLIFLKIMRAIFECSNLSTVKNNHHEISKEECEQIFFEDFEYYCEIVKNAIAAEPKLTYTAGSEKFLDQFTHLDHIRIRLSFILEFCKFFKESIKAEHISLLWKSLAEESPCRVNQELFFKWMNDQINSMGTKQYSVLTDGILTTFFEDYMTNPNNNYAILEQEGFDLIKTLFKIINEKDHKLQILNSAQSKKEHGTVSSASGSTLTSSTYSSSQNSKEFLIYCHPKELKGMDTFWKIIMECNDMNVIALCITFVNAIFHNISEILESQRLEIEKDLVRECIKRIEDLRTILNITVNEPENDSMVKLCRFRKEYAIKQIERFFLNIRSYMENSESHGIGQILLQQNLFDENNRINITIHNKISYGKGCHNQASNPKKFKLEINRNSTIWRLKEIIGEKLDLDPVLIKLEKIGMSSAEYKDSENSKSLKEMRIADGDKFSFTAKIKSNLILKLNLVYSDKQLTPEAERLFEEVFYQFVNEDGYMTRQTCINFLQRCTSQLTSVDDPRITRLFENYDKDKDERVSVEDFKDFYRDSINKKESTVWSNIRSWDYKTDLKKGLHRENRDPKTLLRYALPQNKEFFDYFFNLLNMNTTNPEGGSNEGSLYDYYTAKNSWELIKRLSIHPQMFKDILEFKSYDQEGNEIEFNFHNLVNINNPFHLLYFLDMITYLCLSKQNNETVEVIINEDDQTVGARPNGDKNMQVTGVPVSMNVPTKEESQRQKADAQTAHGINVPNPVPAVPSYTQNPVLTESESGKGRAENVTSASNNNSNIPSPPPIPTERRSDGTYACENPKVKFADQEEGNDDEATWYPPRKEETKSDNKASNAKEVYENYIEPLKPVMSYCDDLFSLPRIEWIKNFIDKGGFEFILNLLISEDSFMFKKINKMDTMTQEEKQCFNTVISLIGTFV